MLLLGTGLPPAGLPAEAITPQGTRGPIAAARRHTWLPHCPRPGESLRAAISNLETACVLAEEAEQREPAGKGEEERVYCGGLSGHCSPRKVDLDTLTLHATHLVTPLPSPRPRLLAHPLQPHWTSCHSLNRQERSLPQGLCTGCSLWPSCSPTRHPHDLSRHLCKTLFTWHFTNCPVLISQFKAAASLADPISLSCSSPPFNKNSSYHPPRVTFTFLFIICLHMGRNIVLFCSKTFLWYLEQCYHIMGPQQTLAEEMSE